MDGDEVTQLLKQAQHCRNLAKSISDTKTEGILRQMADDYERQAAGLKSPPDPTKK